MQRSYSPSCHICGCSTSYKLLAASGDLSRIQQQASSSGRGLPGIALLNSTGSLRTGLAQGRGHLEANMAAALALQSPQEYKRWLSTYASHLAGNFLTNSV